MRMQVTFLRSFRNRILALVLGLVTLVMAATISAIVLKTHRAGDDGNHRHRLAILSELHRAIVSDELELHYQPKVRAGSGQLAGCEAARLHPAQ
jgi:sensor c-di-GMP phosphodiesterase-like protein